MTEPEPSGPSDVTEQTRAFANDLEKLVERYRCEFNLPLFAFVGILEIQKNDLIHEVFHEDS